MIEQKKMDAERAAFVRELEQLGLSPEVDTRGVFKDPFVMHLWSGWGLRSRASLPVGVPDVLFDGFAVLSALSDKAKARTSSENVSDVLDAVVKLIRDEAAAPTVKAEQVPAGLSIAALIVSDVCDLDPEDDGPDCVRVNVNDLLQICERHTSAPSLPAAGSAVEEVEVVEFGWPEYHYQGMGCGLEDRGITDRYEAMQYGWDCAIERCAEIVPDEPIMTVAQHNRIVAALSAQQAGAVSVQRELLSQGADLLEAHSTRPSLEQNIAADFRALLNGGGES